MSMLHLLKFNYLRIKVILTLQSMEINKRSNIEHDVKQAVTLAISEISLPMVRNLKALMYSGSINGANFASFLGSWGELREICMIRWKFAENKT